MVQQYGQFEAVARRRLEISKDRPCPGLVAGGCAFYASRRQFFAVRKPSAYGVVHPDVFVQLFPAQGEAVETQLNLFEQVLGRVGKPRILGGGKTRATAIGQFQANPPGFHPAATRDGYSCRFNDHAFQSDTAQCAARLA